MSIKKTLLKNEEDLIEAKKPRKRELKPGNYARNQAKIKEDKINAMKYTISKTLDRKKKYEKILNTLEDNDIEDDNENEETVSKGNDSSENVSSSSEEEDEREEEIIAGNFI